MSRKPSPYKKGTKPPKTDELTAESIIEDVARKMDYGAGVTVEDALRRLDEFSKKIEELKRKNDNS